MPEGQQQWMPAQRESSALQVHLLGMTELDAALQLQDRIAADITTRRDRFGVLLLCEHPNGLTIGREGSVTDLRIDRSEFEARDVPLRWLRRGGGTWVHHPGQLVAYMLMPADRLKLSMPDVRNRVAASLQAVGREQRLLVSEESPRPGMAARGGQVGFVGLSISEGVTQFGGCLNVSVPRMALDLISWGRDLRPSSISAERMRPTTMAAVRECWIRHLAEQCGYDRYHVWTGHPQLQRTTRRMYVCNPT